MDELFKSWTRPPPESRDPRPVFPPEVTQPIDAALAKMRGVDQRSRNPAGPVWNHSTTPQPPHGHNIGQAGRTSTPNSQYGSHLPRQQASLGLPNLPMQNQHPSYTQPFRPAVPSSIPISAQHMVANAPSQSYPSVTQATTPVNYVYSGPPPPSMSHPARLEKLRFDAQGLLNSVRGHLAVYPHDQEKLKLLQNLQSLKTLLDSGTLSLTHIQSTEIVVANIARNLPPRPFPASAQPSASNMHPQSQLAFDVSSIASILARGSSQAHIPQSQPPQAHHLDTSTLRSPLRGSGSAARPSTIPSLEASVVPISQPNQSSQMSPPGAGLNLGLFEQLRASGLLGATPVQSTPIQAPMAASILTQLMQPQASTKALNDATLDAASLKM